MDGSSMDMEATLRALPKIATRDDGPYALNARAELTRRDSKTLRIRMAVVVMAIVLSIGIILADKL